MDYQKIYNSLIERARNRQLDCYVEKHHVTPRCMHGDDSPQNLVELTPEEHYVAHQLLVKIYPANDKLIFAAEMMCSGRPTNKLYGWLRRKWTEANQKIDRSGKNNSQFGSIWITDGKKNLKIKKDDSIPADWRKGRVYKSSTIAAMGRASTGRVVSAETRHKISEKLKVSSTFIVHPESRSNNTGRTLSNAHREKLRNANWRRKKSLARVVQ